MLSKRYESTEVDRTTWLHVPSGTHWSTSSDTHQVVEIWKKTSSKMYTIFWIGFNLQYGNDWKGKDMQEQIQVQLKASIPSRTWDFLVMDQHLVFKLLVSLVGRIIPYAWIFHRSASFEPFVLWTLHCIPYTFLYRKLLITLGDSLVHQQWHSPSSWNIKRDFF